MSWLDMGGFTIAVAAALECIVGRLAQLDRRHHRPPLIAFYALQACVCIMSASLTWQGKGSWTLEMLALIVAGHLALSWSEWRHGPPEMAMREREFPHGAVPSRIDSGDGPR